MKYILVMIFVLSFGFSNSQVITNPYVYSTASCSYMNQEVCNWSTATGITSTTTLNILDTLVKQMKDSSVWAIFDVINPIAGGTATSHAYNLKDTGTYKFTFSGTVTHASTGMTGNGTTGYANTNFPANTYSNGYMTIAVYLRTNNNSTTVDIGALSNSTRYLQIWSRFGDTYYGQVHTNNSIAENVYNTDSRGFFLACRAGSTSTILGKNSTVNSSSATTTAVVTGNIYVLARNDSGTAAYFSARENAFVLIGDVVTIAQAKTVYNIIQAYQTRMGRQL